MVVSDAEVESTQVAFLSYSDSSAFGGQVVGRVHLLGVWWSRCGDERVYVGACLLSSPVRLFALWLSGSGSIWWRHVRGLRMKMLMVARLFRG